MGSEYLQSDRIHNVIYSLAESHICIIECFTHSMAMQRGKTWIDAHQNSLIIIMLHLVRVRLSHIYLISVSF